NPGGQSPPTAGWRARRRRGCLPAYTRSPSRPTGTPPAEPRGAPGEAASRGLRRSRPPHVRCSAAAPSRVQLLGRLIGGDQGFRIQLTVEARYGHELVVG